MKLSPLMIRNMPEKAYFQTVLSVQISFSFISDV